MQHAIISLTLGLAVPVLTAISGVVYALYFDIKTELPRGDFRRLL